MGSSLPASADQRGTTDSSDCSRQILFQPRFASLLLRASVSPPRVLTRSFTLIPAVFIASGSVQLLGFDFCCSLTPAYNLLYDFCPSGQSFAHWRTFQPPQSGFLQIPPRGGHPCLRLYPSHCRADLGLSLVRTCARRAHSKNRADSTPARLYYIIDSRPGFVRTANRDVLNKIDKMWDGLL